MNASNPAIGEMPRNRYAATAVIRNPTPVIPRTWPSSPGTLAAGAGPAGGRSGP